MATAQGLEREYRQKMTQSSGSEIAQVMSRLVSLAALVLMIAGSWILVGVVAHWAWLLFLIGWGWVG